MLVDTYSQISVAPLMFPEVLKLVNELWKKSSLYSRRNVAFPLYRVNGAMYPILRLLIGYKTRRHAQKVLLFQLFCL